ncbi:MAG: helix-turn-helix transcriptional regulator [Spirochaetia bacterium]|nr:helix-turn-helix transcriptional regulator [Spirochaetia bacterium]
METVKAKETPRFGLLLKQWRQIRGKSQLDLALDASVSARHISFIESGRSLPSKEMIVTLATALNIPLREQNVLLNSAGFAALYGESKFDSDELRESRRALELILTKHEPYPAVVLNRQWDIISGNQAAQSFFGFLLDTEPAPNEQNVLRLMFKQSLARKYVSNWPDVAQALIARTYREALGGVPDLTTMAILSEVLSYPGVPENLRTPDLSKPLAPLVPVIFEKGNLRFNFSSLVTTLGTPQDVTLQELRVECFYPLDETTEKSMESYRRNASA